MVSLVIDRQASATHTIYDVSPYFHAFTFLSAEKCDNLHFSALVSAKMAIIHKTDKFLRKKYGEKGTAFYF